MQIIIEYYSTKQKKDGTCQKSAYMEDETTRHNEPHDPRNTLLTTSNATTSELILEWPIEIQSKEHGHAQDK